MGLMKKQKFFIFDDRGQSKKNSAYSICIRFFRVLPFLHHYFSHPQNQPNLAIHYNNYRCCKILCSILANSKKKETIKKNNKNKIRLRKKKKKKKKKKKNSVKKKKKKKKKKK